MTSPGTQIQFERGDILASRILKRIKLIGPEAAGEEFKRRGLMALPTHGAIKKHLIPPRGHPEASRVKRIVDRLRARNVAPFVTESHWDSLLDLIEFKLHQPTSKDEPPDTLPRYSKGSLVDYTVQEHEAKRAGPHRDIRIGDRLKGLFSWATRKQLPQEGGKIAVHPQSVHPHSYLGWSGNIPKGYGAGTVRTTELGKALVTKSTPDELHATLADKKGSHRLAFIRPPFRRDPDRSSARAPHLLIRATVPQPPQTEKPKAKPLPPEKTAGILKGSQGSQVSVQPKIDGALVYVTLRGGRPEVFSHRVSKTTGKHPIHTERVFGGRPQINIPKAHQRDLVGELYGVRKGKAIPPQELGGILNAHIAESLSKQKKANVNLKIMPFDLLGSKDGSYSERLGKVKETLKYLPKEKFHAPEEATTPGAALRLFQKIKSGRHPLTKEGIVIHREKGPMLKVKNTEEANVRIHSTFPGTGKFRGSPGGFIYSDPHGHPLGKVGTGFTDETRRELGKYIGRTARVRYQERFKSGRLRAPSFIAVEENK